MSHASIFLIGFTGHAASKQTVMFRKLLLPALVLCLILTNCKKKNEGVGCNKCSCNDPNAGNYGASDSCKYKGSVVFYIDSFWNAEYGPFTVFVNDTAGNITAITSRIPNCGDAGFFTTTALAGKYAVHMFSNTVNNSNPPRHTIDEIDSVTIYSKSCTSFTIK